ncbi:MAG TPA: mannitol dehydrogenase family protein [Lysobacter sp.]
MIASRLDHAALAHLQGRASLPAYDRTHARAGVVHLGIGAFHRAHQAVYFDDLLARGRDGYAVVAASLRSDEVARRLLPQHCLYGVLSLAEGECNYRVIGAVREVCVAPEAPKALLSHLCAPQTALVTLTVTEKGYCHRPADGTLDFDHPDIRHDIAHPEAPRSAVGLLATALCRRLAVGVAPPAVLCCDNLPHNGRLLARLVTALVAARGQHALARRIAAEVRFPCSMVDRIVPATAATHRALVQEHYGIDDHGLVVTEPFSQWVIEDAAEVLHPLGEVGAVLVRDVAPFETMKLRLLNGSHSALAYLGYLAGCEYVADAMAVPGMEALVTRLMDEETTPTLQVPGDFDLAGYKQQLRERFRNPALLHRTWQIAMDGSQKLPQRLLGTTRERLAAGAPVNALALAVAAWMRYVGGIDERGEAIDVRDPMAGRLAARVAAQGGNAKATVDALLAVEEVFAPELAQDPRWRKALVTQYTRLQQRGAREAVLMTIQDEIASEVPKALKAFTD